LVESKKTHTISTNTIYYIEDGTGSIEVRIWIDSNDNDMALQSSQYGENMYIRAIGSVRVFNNKRSIMAFHIHLIEDFNEITAHFLEVVKVNLEDMKNNDYEPTNPQKTLPNFGDSQYAPQITNTNTATINGYTPCQQSVIDLIKSQKLNEEGMHNDTIVSPSW